MRHHLNGATKEIAPALLSDNRTVNLPCSDTGGSSKVYINKTFIVTKVEVGLGTILGDEDLAMLIRGHRPRIDVDIWV